MANQTGTATNLEDLFSKIVTFLTTDATLVSASQQWQVMLQRRDNLLALTTNLPASAGNAARQVIHTARYDSRSLNTDDEFVGTNGTYYTSTGFVAGTSFVTYRLRAAKAIAKVRFRAPLSTLVQYSLRDFRLQYSDDGTAWTTALTVSGSSAYSTGEWRDYAVGGTPGSHEYWRVLMDSVQGAAVQVAWSNLLLLEAGDAVANQFGSEVIFKSTGTAGADEIFTGIRSEYSATDSWYNLFLNGYTGFDANERSWFKHPGALPGAGATYPRDVPMVPCLNSSMPYWFAANGRSFRMALKVDTVYEGAYLGFILPYATPGQFPYPLAVGGSLVPQTAARGSEWRHSYANFRHGVYPGPGASAWPTNESISSTLYMRNPAGSWVYFGNRPNSLGTSETVYTPGQGSAAPYAPSGAWRSVWPHCMNDPNTSPILRPYRECLGGGYILQPTVMLQRAPTPTVFGELEGTYSVSGFSNAAENTTTWAGKTVVIFQNAYRNTVHEFWALSLD